MKPEEQLKSSGETSSVDLLFRRSLDALDGLDRRIKRGRDITKTLESMRWVIETLPLTSADFCAAINRFSNVATYLARRESGLATFELRMLTGLIARCAAAYAGNVETPAFRRGGPAPAGHPWISQTQVRSLEVRA